jgi:hypothetical protein
MASNIGKVITYIVQLGMMGFASYMLNRGLAEAGISPQAALDLSICLFVVLAIIDMILSDKSDIHNADYSHTDDED